MPTDSLSSSLFSISGEALEETGLVLDPASAKFVTANNNVMKDIGRHYVDIFISAKVLGDPTPKVISVSRQLYQLQMNNHTHLIVLDSLDHGAEILRMLGVGYP